MTTDEPPSVERFSLSRWSRRKHEAARTAQQDAAPANVPAPGGAAAVVPAGASAPAAAAAPPDAAPAPLPPVDSLTPDSDFAPFVQPKVDEATKRAALKKLFADPRFNVMDGLDVYVDDYTQPDPMPTALLDKLARVYDVIAGDDKSAAAKDAGTLPGPVAAAPESVPPEPAVEPAQLADDGAAAAAPLTPTLAPRAGRGSTKDAAS